jgi:mannobiose 2-epimerase
LATRSAEFWKRCGPDPVNGGFYGTLDDAGTPTLPRDKTLIQQVRHLYGWSIWYEHKEPTASVRALADDLYRFVTQNYCDPASGEYVYAVDETGRVVENSRILYAQAFAIYGFAEYGRVFEQKDARARALALFDRINARAHDADHGGYLQLNDAKWLLPGALKDTNTHIHLMEAFTTLYVATGEARVEQRLAELVQLITGKLLQPEGYLHKDFAADWTPLGPKRVSYGHDLETYWLLDMAARALGRAEDPAILGPARRMGVFSARRGYDATQGGYFEEGPPDGAPDRLEKVWWAQAEAIPALFRLFEQTADSDWLARMNATLDFIERSLLTPAGEWYWGVMPDGSLGPRGSNLGEAWKASYHVLRALVFTETWMSSWLTERESR